MTVIRTPQLDAFKQSALRSFENDMVLHLSAVARRHCDALGEPGVRDVIRLGIARAGAHGLTCRGPVRFYIELMFMLGSAFDTDPQLPWAADILADDGIDQMARADRLHDSAMEYIDKVFGPEGAYALRALRAIPALAERLAPFPAPALAPVMLGHLREIYPQKHAFVGEPHLLALIGESEDLARAHGFATARSTALIVVLMFSLGHGFDRDPLFPWVSRTLGDPQIPDPARRAQRLEERMLTYLARVLRQAGAP